MNLKDKLLNVRVLLQFVEHSILAAIVIALATGCATTNRKTTTEGAFVCPQCKMVAVKTSHQPGGYYPGLPSGRWQTGPVSPATTYEHRCPNCQGALSTLIREGKLKHRCSVCQDAPFICPVFHPTAKAN